MRSFSLPKKTARGDDDTREVDFENIPAISLMRNKIEVTFTEWTLNVEDTVSVIYPTFLLKGDPGNSVVMQDFSNIEMSKMIDTEVPRALRLGKSRLEEALEKSPSLVDVYEMYTTRDFKRGGAFARVNFFRKSRIVKVFSAVA
ncbi:unnamed protein product, partial [Discosporangium mesarthrocarpum]